MNVILRNILLAVIFVAIAVLAGCGGETGKNTSEPPQNSAETPEVVKEKTPAPDSVPLSSEITQSELKDVSGTTFKLADKKGKVILLNLWATWCGPCRGEMPTLVKLQNDYREQGFEIIGLNTDDEPVDKINPFVAEMKLNYTIVWSDANLQNELLKISKFPGIPQSFLIDRDGNLRAVFTGGGASTIHKIDENVTKVVQEKG